MIMPCDGGCGSRIDPLNEACVDDPSILPTAVIDDIIDPFTGEAMGTAYCDYCAILLGLGR